jgi:hypothetical protein
MLSRQLQDPEILHNDSFWALKKLNRVVDQERRLVAISLSRGVRSSLSKSQRPLLIANLTVCTFASTQNRFMQPTFHWCACKWKLKMRMGMGIGNEIWKYKWKLELWMELANKNWRSEWKLRLGEKLKLQMRIGVTNGNWNCVREWDCEWRLKI